MKPVVPLLDPGFVRLDGRWLPTNRASDHRAAGHTVDPKLKPLRAEIQPLYCATRRRSEYPCDAADNRHLAPLPAPRRPRGRTHR